ncbi:hypothetical protein [Vulcanisaeta distributa]|uniref:hypothetical protein n=1 Tax=Vulcanisaeta distributa TaxID=164451 RepID=UPI000AB24B2C|nr:hypothetical protein [Vulcanisaeta distributa]
MLTLPGPTHPPGPPKDPVWLKGLNKLIAFDAKARLTAPPTSLGWGAGLGWVMPGPDVWELS